MHRLLISGNSGLARRIHATACRSGLAVRCLHRVRGKHGNHCQSGHVADVDIRIRYHSSPEIRGAEIARASKNQRFRLARKGAALDTAVDQ